MLLTSLFRCCDCWKLRPPISITEQLTSVNHQTSLLENATNKTHDSKHVTTSKLSETLIVMWDAENIPIHTNEDRILKFINMIGHKTWIRSYGFRKDNSMPKQAKQTIRKYPHWTHIYNDASIKKIKNAADFKMYIDAMKITASETSNVLHHFLIVSSDSDMYHLVQHLKTNEQRQVLGIGTSTTNINMKQLYSHWFDVNRLHHLY